MKKTFICFLLMLIINIVFAQVKTKEYDLKHWPKGKGPEEIGTRITEKFLQSPHKRSSGNRPGVDYSVPPPYINYPEVCTWLGGLWFAGATKNDDLFKRLERRFSPLFEGEKNLLPIPNNVDNSVFGSVPLELYLKTKDQKYLEMGLKYADLQWDLSEDANPNQKTWADQGYSWQTRLMIDDMFMITAVQVQAFQTTKNNKYLNRAAREMVLYLDKLQLRNGLFYHSPEAQFCWGRGNGWMAVGMAEILRILPKDSPYRDRIMAGYLKMMDALLKYQTEDGMWRQIIDDPELWKETSGTAMFLYAMITGVKNDWLDKKTYGAAARRGWLELTNYINENDELTEVCAGTGARNDRKYYIDRPHIVGDFHGQAPVLWCATALVR